MRNTFKFVVLSIFVLVTFAFFHYEANAQYLPVGPQTNVSVDTVVNGGWTQCFIDTYANEMNPQEVLEQCPENLLMLACRETESGTLMVLAQGNRSDVTFDTGTNSDETHIANGVGWYFNTTGDGDVRDSWGFVRAGDSVDKDECDEDTSGANDERLCWHLETPVGGYRCGDVLGLNDSSEYERIVYMSSQSLPTTQVPTLSEWGLIALAGILGIVGFMVIRRRRATA